jgi:hypothetical protein
MKRLICCLGLLSLVAAAPAVAAEAPVLIPGGQLDPGIAGADAYVGDPQAADPGTNRACRQARRYIETLRAGRYDDMAKLFAPDAVFLDPLRVSVHGRLNIADFYRNKVGALRPQVQGVAYVGQGNDCILELAVQMQINGVPHYVLQGLDHFTLNTEGKFSRMVVFLRPAPVAATMSPAGGH